MHAYLGVCPIEHNRIYFSMSCTFVYLYKDDEESTCFLPYSFNSYMLYLEFNLTAQIKAAVLSI